MWLYNQQLTLSYEGGKFLVNNNNNNNKNSFQKKHSSSILLIKVYYLTLLKVRRCKGILTIFSCQEDRAAVIDEYI